MTNPPANTAPPAPASLDAEQDRARIQRQMRLLDLLAYLGSLIATLLHHACIAQKPGEGGLAGIQGFLAQLGLQDRVSRAVRLAIALRLRLQERLAGAPPHLAPAPAPRPDPLAKLAKMTDIDWDKELDREFAEEMREALEGLEGGRRSEFSKAFLDRPAEDLIASICRDLGLDPAWAAQALDAPDPPDVDQIASAAVETLIRRTRPKPKPPARQGRTAKPEAGPIPPPAGASP